MSAIIAWWNKLVTDLNKKGIPVPLLRDGKSGEASLSYTLVILSFSLWAVSVIGKAAGALGGINTGDCMSMFMACGGLYFGRKMQKDGKSIVVDGDKIEEVKKD